MQKKSESKAFFVRKIIKFKNRPPHYFCVVFECPVRILLEVRDQIENMSAILSNEHSNPSQNTNKEVAHFSNSLPPTALISSQENVISRSQTSLKRDQSIFSGNSFKYAKNCNFNLNFGGSGKDVDFNALFKKKNSDNSSDDENK